jgi:[ribosomal protein S18]-alanine N-acetyltransferase
MKIVCSTSTPADLEQLVALESLCFRHPGERFHLRQIRSLLNNPRAIVVFARAGGVIAGWAVGLLRRTGPRTCAGRLYDLSVHPDFRGQGLGIRLAQHVLARLRRRGAKTFSLEVRTPNPAAQQLYLRLGFQPAGKLPDYYGPGLHGLRMRKPLHS